MNVNLIIVFLILAVVGITLFFLRNTYFIRKYWGYLLILVPAGILILLKILTIKTKKEEKSIDKDISSVKEDLQEVQQKAAIQVTAIRQKNKDKLEELKEVTKISNKKERLERLARMMKL